MPVRIVDSEADDGALAFAAPALKRSGPVDDSDLAVALSILGIGPADVVAAEWIDNGPGWLGVLLRDADAVLVLEPDLAPRAGQRSIGVVGFHGPDADAAIEVRAFLNDGGGPLREAPVMRSLNASVAQWLTASGRTAAPYVARQGARAGRDGRVHVTEAEGELWIGGRAVETVTGTAET